jgi:hypothetical protein
MARSASRTTSSGFLDSSRDAAAGAPGAGAGTAHTLTAQSRRASKKAGFSGRSGLRKSRKLSS